MVAFILLLSAGLAAAAQDDSPPGAERGRGSAKSRALRGSAARGGPIRSESPPSAGAAPAKEAKAAPARKPLNPDLVIPKRELVFDQSDEAYPITADPARYGPKFVEVLQDRYVAILNLQVRNRYLGSATGRIERDVQSSTGVWYFPAADPALLASKVPQDRLPSAEIMGMLTRAGHVQFGKYRRDIERNDQAGSPSSDLRTQRFDFELALTAPTAERAKELAQAVLVLYDYGYSFPAYQGYVDLYEDSPSRLSDERAKIKAMQDELAAGEKELASLKPYDEITSEALASLVSQKQLNIVERAGVLARIAACEKVLDQLKKSPRSPKLFENAESVKVAAEIELAGLEAKQAAIDDLVQKSRRRLELASSAFRLASSIRLREGRSARDIEARAAGYKAAVDEKMPFAKVEGKILIRRIKWEQPKPPAKQ